MEKEQLSNLADRTVKYGPENRPNTPRALTDRYNKLIYFLLSNINNNNNNNNNRMIFFLRTKLNEHLNSISFSLLYVSLRDCFI